MTILNAHLDGNRVVLDDPIPEGTPANAKLRIIIEGSGPSRVLAAIAKLTNDASKLPHSANQHKHD